MPITLLIASEWSLVAVLIWLYASNSHSAVHPMLFFLGKEIYILGYSEQNRFHLQWVMWKSNIQVVLLEKYDILILKIWNGDVARTFSFYLLQMKEEICKKSPVSHSSWNVLNDWKNWSQCWLLCYTSLSWNHTCKVHIFSTSQASACLHSAAWASPCLKDTYRKRSRLAFFCAKLNLLIKRKKTAMNKTGKHPEVLAMHT